MILSQVRKLPNEKIIELIKTKKIDINNKYGNLPKLAESGKVNKTLQENFCNYLINKKIGKEKKQIIKNCGNIIENDSKKRKRI